MSENKYLHGYSVEEQDRLVYQSEFWKDKLILNRHQFPISGKLLEIGCGVGACINILSAAFPQLEISGIDISKEQIDYANRLLNQKKGLNVELKTGDASSLPWENDSFDHIFIMWVLEHIGDKNKVLEEAYRVLRKRGRITVIEADYKAFLAYPNNSDYDYLATAQYEIFNKLDNGDIGRKLGPLLQSSNFKEINVSPFSYYYHDKNQNGFHQHIAYITTFLEGYLQTMAEELNKNHERLKSGFEYLRNLPNIQNSSFSHTVYKGIALK
jgi:ubiquinone/menaquinone biosynthesis C-methylase UbiE